MLKELLKPIRDLFSDVKRKALMRLEYEGLHKAEAITTPGARFYKDPAGFAMDRYAYYVCYKCKKVFQQYMFIYMCTCKLLVYILCRIFSFLQ